MILDWVSKNCKFAMGRKDFEIKVFRDGKYLYTHQSRNKASEAEALNSLWGVLAEETPVGEFRGNNRNRYRFEIQEYKPLETEPFRPEPEKPKQLNLF